jgi:hypothetical protein
MFTAPFFPGGTIPHHPRPMHSRFRYGRGYDIGLTANEAFG